MLFVATLLSKGVVLHRRREPMKYAIVVTTAAGLAASAHAQNTQLTFEASVNGGPWTGGTAAAAPGDEVRVRLSVRLVNTTRTTLGACGIILQPTLSGWNTPAGD